MIKFNRLRFLIIWLAILLSGCQARPDNPVVISPGSSPTEVSVVVGLPPTWTPVVLPSPSITPSKTLPSLPQLSSNTGPTTLPNNIIDPQSHRIAYVSVVEGYKRIFTIYEDGSNSIQITNGEYFDTEPTWSHDGKLIAFLRALEEHPRRLVLTHVYLTDVDGSNLTNLTTSMDINANSIAWGPNDQALAFDAGYLPSDPAFSGSNIFIVDINTQTIDQITDVPLGNVGCKIPSWSPDESHLVYRCRGSMVVGLVVSNRDGTDLFYIDFLGQFDQGIWLPSGQSIAYTGGMPCYLGTISAEYMLQKGEIEFVSQPCMEERIEELNYDITPIYAIEWSAIDDTRFIVQSDELIQIIDLDRGEIIEIEGNYNDVEGQISWGPEDEWVVFTYHDGNDFELAIVDLQSQEITQITDNTQDDLMPAWQP